MTAHRSHHAPVRLVLAGILTAIVAGTGAAAAPPPTDPTPLELERAIEQQGWSAGTLFELGNAYASSGRPGPAILAYERAEVIAPRDRAIAANLARTREAAGLTAPEPSRIDAALGFLGSDEWTWIAIGSAILACVGVIAYAWSGRGRTAGAIAIAGTLVGAAGLTAANQVAPAANAAVVVRGDTARIAPAATADAAFTAPEGESVRIEQRHGDFIYVRDGDRTGWLPSTAVERVITTERHAGRA